MKQAYNTAHFTKRMFVLFCLFVTCVSIVTAQPLLNKGQASVAQEIKQGREAFDAGNLTEAKAHFEAAIALDSSSVEAHYRLGQTFWRMRNVEMALQLFDKTAEMGKNNATLQMSLAGFYEQAKMLERAVAQYRKVMALSGDSELGKTAEKRLNLVLVKQYAANSDVDTALQLLNSMLEEYPNDLRVLQHLGFAYLLVNRFESAAAVYEEVLEQEPESDSAHMNIAGVYEKMGNLSAAIKHFRLAAKYAKRPAIVLEAKIRSGILESQLLQEKSDLAGAAKVLEELLELKPDLSVASNRLSRMYAEQGDKVEAMRVLENALEISPQSYDMRLNLASLYADQKNFIDAVWELGLILNAKEGNAAYVPRAKQLMQQIANVLGDKFKQVVQAAQNKNNLIAYLAKNPDDSKARFQLGVIYTGQRHYKKAKAEFEHVVKLEPNHTFSYLYLGEVASFLGDYKLASDSFARYISLETDLEKVDKVEVPYASTLARLLISEKKNEQALDQLERIVKLAPGDAYAWYQMGLLRARKGELDEAVDAYSKVLEVVPNNSLARYNRALIYEQLGRESDAYDEYQQVAITEQKNDRIRDAAEKKVKLLKARLNGLTATASYSISYDGNSNLSRFNPTTERISSLSAAFTYRYRYDDDWLFGVSYSPTYTMYHVGHSDFLSLALSPTITYGKRGDLWTFTHRVSSMESLLNEEGVSDTVNTTLAWNKNLKPGRQLASTLGFQRFKGATTSRFDSNTYSVSSAYSRTLEKGVRDSLKYSFTYLQNVDDANEDAAYIGNGLTYNLSKWFSQKLALSGNLSVTRNLYLKTDRFTRFANSTIPPTKRLTTLYAFRLSATYRQSDTFRFFASLTYQLNESNLPILVFVRGNPARNEPDIIRPIRADELIGVPLTSSSLGKYKKTSLNFGISVSF